MVAINLVNTCMQELDQSTFKINCPRDYLLKLKMYHNFEGFDAVLLSLQHVFTFQKALKLSLT